MGLPALGALMVSSSYRLKRVMAFLHPDDNPASSYQSLQALVSLGNGGIFGTGLGTSTQKLGYLPMPFTDTVFSILGEELGLMGTGLCLLLFAVVIWRGLRIAFLCPDRFGSLAALGITVSLAVNVIMHVGVCAKFFPTTGQPLPFLSYGGTSLVVGLFAMGVLLGISGHSLETMPESWRANPKKWALLAGAAAKSEGPPGFRRRPPRGGRGARLRPPGPDCRPGQALAGRRAMKPSIRLRSLHFVGIGGAGMSVLAEVLWAWGFRISGSDGQRRRGDPATARPGYPGRRGPQGREPPRRRRAGLFLRGAHGQSRARSKRAGGGFPWCAAPR